MALVSINPSNQEVIDKYPVFSKAAVDLALVQAGKAFLEWRDTGFNFRRTCFMKCSEYLLDNKSKFASLITKEMGKPITQSVSEIEKCAWVCEYYAVMAQDFLKDEHIESDATESFVSYEPLGTIFAIMPWNFPFWQVFRFAAPALMAGNTAVLKHASNVPQCALAIEEVFKNSGFHDNVFQSLLINNDIVEDVIADPAIKAVTITGSEAAGSIVASTSGKHIKKTVLELGGSDPFIVLPDAEIDRAAQVAADSRLLNSGQSCIAAKRFIVVSSVFDEFLDSLKKYASEYVPANPLSPDAKLGPLAREDLVQSLLRQVDKSLEQGAVLTWGGGRPDLDGSFVNPAILTNVQPGMPAWEEELFGPVFSLIKVESEEEAIRVANDNRYGLGASLWTSDMPKAIELAKGIESGAVFINGLVKSDPRLPFGGIKKSGYGRELSTLGIKEFVNAKTVWIK
ncbi:NAD-dependent succinate-semialdehyde dehydrogenase [Cytophagaceae bacterium ABcell3]|nr:NAD-dependent succinate-semialdehyde dehydrogenase [Cytophagaceae bacterium ABcell3]